MGSTAAENAVTRDAAVIDVGSNSVRMVHFRLEGRALWPVFNEKVMAGLGEGVRKTGRLNPDGVEIALAALKRFSILLDAKGVHDRRAVATAAVRDAEDGPAFAERVLMETDFELKTLSGAEEGRLSCVGLAAGIPGAHGVVGDLGGSSLELAPVIHGAPRPALSVGLGPQAAWRGESDRKTIKKRIENRLDEVDWLRGHGGDFYAIGGAWRALAYLSMAERGDPLHVVHQYTLQRPEADRILRLAERLSPASLTGVAGISSRRAPVMPYAAYLMRRVLKRGRFDRLVFSAYGLREGVLMDGAPDAIMEADPLIAGAEALARPGASSPSFGRALADWIEPALAQIEPVFPARRHRILQAAASRLADLGARLHPDHRADLVRDLLLYAPFAGINHRERVFLAAALHYRYGGKRSVLDGLAAMGLLGEDGHAAAEALGLALRLGATLSGRSENLLAHFRLEADAATIRLTPDETGRELVFYKAENLLGALASATGRKGQLEA